MYSGPFNLNIWLRSFVRADLVDAYEKRCLEIVNEYAGHPSTQVLMEMFADLNRELIVFGSSVLKNHHPNQDGNIGEGAAVGGSSCRIFTERPKDPKIEDVWIEERPGTR